MEKIVEQTLLYEFYGELLTSHQKRIYEDFVWNDFSLSEIAEVQGISRQGVHDLIKRCNKILAGYEEKLHLIEKFQKTQTKIRKINELTKEFEENPDGSKMEQIKNLSNEILEEL